jgi:hypothetical protein
LFKLTQLSPLGGLKTIILPKNKQMENSIAFQLLYVAHNNQKQKFNIAPTQLHVALVGAMLLDLFRSDEIKINGDKVICNHQNAVQSKYPELFEKLLKSKKERSIKTWIQRLSMHGNKFMKKSLQKMHEHQLLKVEFLKFLGFIPYHKTAIVNKGKHASTVKSLKDIVLLNKEADELEHWLLTLLAPSKLILNLCKDREERKRMKVKLKNYKVDNRFGDDVHSVMRDMEAAFVVAIASTAAINASTHH